MLPPSAFGATGAPVRAPGWPAPILRPGAPAPRWWLAVDGGGTHTRLRLAEAGGRVRAEGQAGPSALGQGAAAAWGAMEAALASAAAQAGLPPPAWADCALAAGLSGAGVAGWAQAFREADPGCAALLLASDGEAALQAAFAGGPGVLLIAGTGSVCEVRRADGQRATVGGWGWRCGDEGSGAWLGRQALAHAQRAVDGRAVCGALARAVLAAVQAAVPCQAGGAGAVGDAASPAAALQAYGDRARQGDLAALAPWVTQAAAQGDPAAEALLAQAARELEALVQAADPSGRLPVVLAGSVARHLQPRLHSDTRARCQPALADAPAGALQWLRAAFPTSSPKLP
ncbi:BadF/BadG/BcrA/BcrD ATPase family protein [Rubrivivax rivuli]|uniref:BadF/BadG/BcrA/BcrD ATPase family protein n=1 Tax=Rubrivivax rivuli TaxID=1862385 RepID=UPI0013E3E46A|nr:BadF/BadG/BcrA/BcrD ATPase family protein [Rubrivivax rivuli]